MAAKRSNRPARAPTRLTLRAYQVGFGDCFLLTWHYSRTQRHVLIDFGSNGQPTTAPKNLLNAIADDIRKQCGGKLDAIVLTHRHKDHITGFTTQKDGSGPGDVIRALGPDVVVQPWTEDPNAKTDATEATTDGIDGKSFVSMLSAMHTVSAGVVAEAGRLAATETAPWRRQMFQGLTFLGEEGILNRSAVENLMAMGKAGTATYVRHGQKSGLEKVLPGVGITVLGPPTLKQSSAIKKERTADATEFWMLRAAAGERMAAGGEPPFPAAATLSSRRPPPYARWFVPRVRSIRAEGLLSIVRIMDDAMNNTSVILLFEVGDSMFLFPGDAQIENWQYTLDQPELMRKLANVTFYKVGHHGSRNATPKTLWFGFTHRGPANKPGRLRTVVSTMADKYGSLAEGTEVPRRTLVTELQKNSDFFTTQSLGGNKLSQDFEFEL
jgi:hypothetical protein